MSKLEFGEFLEVNDDEQFACRSCGEVLSPVTECWKEGAVMVEESTSNMGVHWVNERDDFVFRRFICPNCKVQIDTEAALEEDDPLPWYSPPTE